MNKDRRKQLEDVKDSLDEIIASLNDIKDEEQDAYDNMPESLQSSDNGSRMTDAHRCNRRSHLFRRGGSTAHRRSCRIKITGRLAPVPSSGALFFIYTNH